MSSHSVKLPDSIRHAAARLARQDGVSLNHWIATAVAQKVGVVETAATLLRDRAGSAQPEDLLRLLEQAPDVPPLPGDEIERPT